MQVAFIYNDIFRYSNFGSNHPVLARRVSNVYDFSKILPIRSKINFIYNEIADLSTLSIFHSKDYLEVLKKTELTQSISKIDSERYNLGTTSNPIFNEMYKRHATSAGALLLAVDLVVIAQLITCCPSVVEYILIKSSSDIFKLLSLEYT